MFSDRTSVKEVVSSDVLRFMERDFCDSFETNHAISQNDLQFLSKLDESICYKDGHYEMPLPFKINSPALPNIRVLVRSLQKRSLNDEKFRQHYTQFMSDLIDKGHAEKS